MTCSFVSEPVTMNGVLGDGAAIALMVIVGRLASGSVVVPAVGCHVSVGRVLNHQRLDAFLCQMLPLTQAISMTLAVVVSTTPLTTTSPPADIDQRFPPPSFRLAVEVVMKDPLADAPPTTAVAENETEPLFVHPK